MVSKLSSRLPSRTVRRLALAILVVAAVPGCKPDVGGRASLVDEPRVLAIRAVPAEAKPGEKVTFEALVTSENEANHAGAHDASATLAWALCNDRKPLVEQGAVNESCLVPQAAYLTQIGSGAQTAAEIPDDACRRFGPDSPEPEPGEPPGRPVDPDTTGGYYQPLRVRYEGEGNGAYSSAEVRIQCGLAGATGAQLNEYTARYRLNVNPELASLELVKSGATTGQPIGEGANVDIAAGSHVTFRAHWKPCDDGLAGDAGSASDAGSTSGDTGSTSGDAGAAETGCTGAESYVLLDPTARQIVSARESIRLSWFATAGTFDVDRTGRAPDDHLMSSENGWTAPASGSVRFWVVIRDDRGGTSWQTFAATLR